MLEWDYYQTNHPPLRVHHQTRSLLWLWFDQTHHQIKTRVPVLPLQTVTELWLLQTVYWERQWNQTVLPVRVPVHQNRTRAPVPAVQKVMELVVVAVQTVQQRVRVAQTGMMTLRVVAVQTQSVVQTAMALAAAVAVQSHHHQTRIVVREPGSQREEPVLQNRRAPCWWFAAADQSLRMCFVTNRTL